MSDDNNEDSSDNQESHNENDDMKNLHEDNIDEVTEQLSNISINDQNISNIRKGQTVSFSLSDENYIAEILTRAGKPTGTFNVQYHHPSSKLPNSYVDFDKVKNFQIIKVKKVAFKMLNNKSLRIGNPIKFILKLLNLTNDYSIANGFAQ